MRALIPLLFVILIMITWSDAASAEPNWSSAEMNIVKASTGEVIANVDHEGYALKGYDPVSYYTGRPHEGSPDFSTEYKGVAYRFASAENQERFLDDPERYTPKYGAFCAYGVIHERPHLSDIDPHSYLFVNGKFVFFLNDRVREGFIAEVSERGLRAVLQEGGQKWSELKQSPKTWDDVSSSEQ